MCSSDLAIPFFTDEREEYLEYDVARLIQNLKRPEKPVLGIVTNIPLDTGAGGLQAAMRGESQSFLIYDELLDRLSLRSEEHTSELQSLAYPVSRLLLDQTKTH